MSKNNVYIVLMLLLVTAIASAQGATPESDPEPLASDDGLTFHATDEEFVTPTSPVDTLRQALAPGQEAPSDPVGAVRELTQAVADQFTFTPFTHVAKPRDDDDTGFPGLGSARIQGDANGDGRSEVFLLQYPVDGAPTDGGAHTLRMIAGSGGDTLWTAELEADLISWVPAVDLDGDGLTDVMALALRADGEPTPIGDFIVQPFTWQLVAYRGSDGSVLWEDVESWSYVYAPGGPNAGSVLSPAFFYIAIVGPDADGDGGLDVWLNVIDAAALYDGAPLADARAHRFTLLSGADGTQVSAVALATASQGSSIAFPTPDLSGDGLADTVINAFPTAPVQLGSPRPATIVSAAAGTTGLPLWARTFQDAFAIGLPFGDLSGDGRGDLVTAVIPAGQGASLEGVAGADGSTLWTIADPLFLFFAAGNIDGVAGGDIVFLDADPSGGVLYPRVQGIAGDTGSVIYDSNPFGIPIPPGGYAAVELRPLAGDFDGDGSQDTILNSRNGVFPDQYSGDIHAVRSADGMDHLVVSGTEYWGLPAGDLTGDGFDDVMRILVDVNPYTVSFAGIDITSGEELWEHAIAESQGVTIRSGGDLGGTPAQDLLTSSVTPGEGGPTDDGPTTELSAWDGPTGAVLWEAP